MDFLVYIIYSISLDKFYIGYTGDFEKRISVETLGFLSG